MINDYVRIKLMCIILMRYLGNYLPQLFIAPMSYIISHNENERN